MYTGNGVTKNFPIPKGYDGAVVVLKMPGGKGILMKQGESYTIENGRVVFTVAVPSGIEVCFDEREAEIIPSSQKNYVIIRSDGTIEEVSEDPAVLLAEAREILTASEKIAGEVERAVNEAKNYIAETVSASHGDLDGRLDGYSKTAQNIANETAARVKSEVTKEFADLFEEMRSERKRLRGELAAAEILKNEMKTLVRTALDTTKTAIFTECEDVITSCRDMKKLKDEIAVLADEAQETLRKTAREEAEEFRTKLAEGVEDLKNLRIKLEENFNMLNNKITNRWEVLEERLRNG